MPFSALVKNTSVFFLLLLLLLLVVVVVVVVVLVVAACARFGYLPRARGVGTTHSPCAGPA